MSDPTVDCKHCHGTGMGAGSSNDGMYNCAQCGGTGRQPMPLNPWHPEKDANALKHLGKLAEESSELTSACARCIIQGIDEREPVTGKLNRDWLRDEIADVLANIHLVRVRFGMFSDADAHAINERAERKISHLARWHAMGEE